MFIKGVSNPLSPKEILSSSDDGEESIVSMRSEEVNFLWRNTATGFTIEGYTCRKLLSYFLQMKTLDRLVQSLFAGASPMFSLYVPCKLMFLVRFVVFNCKYSF